MSFENDRTKIRYVVDALDSELLFYGGSGYNFTSIDGISTIIGEDTTSRGFRQDGTTLEYTQFGERDVTLDFYIECNSHDEYLNKRDKAIKMFSPNIVGKLYYSDGVHSRYLNCHPETTPDIEKSTPWQTMAKCSVTLIANDPFFYDSDERMVQLASWTGGFCLAAPNPPTHNGGVRFPSSGGITGDFKLKTRGGSSVTIFNEGHVDCPVRVTFKGAATNPRIDNLTTGKYIALSGVSSSTFDATKELIVNTAYGKKTAIFRDISSGAETNGLQYLSLLSDFFSLVPGENVISYSSDVISQVNEVSVAYSPRYLGV